MKKIIPIIAIVLLAVVSCQHSTSGIQLDKLSKGTMLSFWGKSIILNDSVYEQIAAIAEQDKMLSYKDSIIQIGDVRWRINLMSDGIALMTSVQPDDSRMKQVVKYLNSIYGNPYDEVDAFSMKWSSSDYQESRLVHLRRVNSEEGGTLLFFN